MKNRLQPPFRGPGGNKQPSSCGTSPLSFLLPTFLKIFFNLRLQRRFGSGKQLHKFGQPVIVEAVTDGDSRGLKKKRA